MVPHSSRWPARILLVEDDSAHAELIESCLLSQRNVQRVCRAIDGKAALDFLYRRRDFADPGKSPRPDLILMDLRLPKIDGLEVLGEIKNNDDLRTIPVIILSTSNAHHDVIAAYGRHTNGYLVKPVDFGELSEMLSALCNYWLNWNQSRVASKPD